MKKIFSIVLSLSMLTSLVFVACSENEETQINSKSVLENNSNVTNKKEFHIHHAEWDGWGRTSRNCDGFGLCHYSDCWFCCTENEVVVNCNDKKRIPNAGEITIFDETKTGYLTIKLDPTDSIHLDAINNAKILYIDENISSEKTILHKGEYLFDASIGKHGGYKISASEK